MNYATYDGSLEADELTDKVIKNLRKNTWNKYIKNNQKGVILDLQRGPFGDGKWYLFVSWPALGTPGASQGGQWRGREAQGAEN